jgi:hypothetical protein
MDHSPYDIRTTVPLTSPSFSVFDDGKHLPTRIYITARIRVAARVIKEDSEDYKGVSYFLLFRWAGSLGKGDCQQELQFNSLF